MLRRQVAAGRSGLAIKRALAFGFLAYLLFLSQPGGHAQTARPPLKLFKNYFLTGGNYVVGGKGIRGRAIHPPDLPLPRFP